MSENADPNYSEWLSQMHQLFLRAALRRRSTAAEAEELAQQTITEILINIEYIRSRENPNYYALAIFNNVRAKYFRERMHQVNHRVCLDDLSEEEEPQVPSLEAAFLASERYQQLQRMIDKLDERSRQIIRLKAAGRTNKEIGDKFGLQESTVRKELTRIYEKLERCKRGTLLDRLRHRLKPNRKEGSQ